MAMKIVRFNCCGMDVHKNLVVATIGITDRKTNVTEYFQRSFSTLNSDLYRLKDWLRSHHCSDVCMESTGKYWIPIFNVLEDEINVHLTHPKYVKAIKGKKTDKKDSKWICDLFKHDLIKFFLSLQERFENCVRSHVTDTNWSACVLQNGIVIRTV